MTREEMILSERRKVKLMARLMAHRDRSLSVEDLEQEANLALLRVHDRFDTEAGVQFHSYADQRIEGAMRDALRLERRGGIAGGIGAAGQERHALPFRLTCELGEEVRLTLRTEQPPCDPWPSELRRAIERLEPRRRSIVVLYYEADRTEMEIARALGINESRVCQLLHQALRELRELMSQPPPPRPLPPALRSPLRPPLRPPELPIRSKTVPRRRKPFLTLSDRQTIRESVEPDLVLSQQFGVSVFTINKYRRGMRKLGRPAMCTCGDCPRCGHRARNREYRARQRARP